MHRIFVVENNTGYYTKPENNTGFLYSTNPKIVPGFCTAQIQIPSVSRIPGSSSESSPQYRRTVTGNRGNRLKHIIIFNFQSTFRPISGEM